MSRVTIDKYSQKYFIYSRYSQKFSEKTQTPTLHPSSKPPFISENQFNTFELQIHKDTCAEQLSFEALMLASCSPQVLAVHIISNNSHLDITALTTLSFMYYGNLGVYETQSS